MTLSTAQKWTGFGKKNTLWYNLRHYPFIYLRSLRKITRKLSQNSRTSGWDLNPGTRNRNTNLTTLGLLYSPMRATCSAHILLDLVKNRLTDYKECQWDTEFWNLCSEWLSPPWCTRSASLELGIPGLQHYYRTSLPQLTNSFQMLLIWYDCNSTFTIRREEIKGGKIPLPTVEFIVILSLKGRKRQPCVKDPHQIAG